jgi:hypothetical protein
MICIKREAIQNILYNLTCMKYPEKANLDRQKVDWCLPGAQSGNREGLQWIDFFLR